MQHSVISEFQNHTEIQIHSFIDLPQNTKPLILVGDVIEKLKEIPTKSISCIITSPPYWGQRDYEVKGQIGQERTPEEYIQKIVEVGNELKRVLKDNGCYFLNIGDKYMEKNLLMIPSRVAIEMQKNGWLLRNFIVWHKPNHMPTSIKDRFNNTWEAIFFFVKDTGKYYTPNYFFEIDNVRIPHKTESEEIGLPLTLTKEEYEKLKDKIKKENNYNGKFKGHEKNRGASPGARASLFGEYYSEQRVHKITEKEEIEIIKFLRKHREKKGISPKEIDKKFGYLDTAGHWFRLDHGRSLPKPTDWFKLKEILCFDDRYDKIMTETHYVLQMVKHHPKGKNPGDVWVMPTAKLQYAHFAVFPEELPKRVILACCPKDGIVLDPFAGSGTTGKVAMELGRKSILIEINKDYVKIIKRRCGLNSQNLEKFID